MIARACVIVCFLFSFILPPYDLSLMYSFFFLLPSAPTTLAREFAMLIHVALTRRGLSQRSLLYERQQGSSIRLAEAGHHRYYLLLCTCSIC